MTDSLIPLFVFVAVIAALPWLVRRIQSHVIPQGGVLAGGRVISALAVGPQQRVVTVQLRRGREELTMVLGVTASTVTCLHTWVGAETPVNPSPAEVASVGVGEAA